MIWCRSLRSLLTVMFAAALTGCLPTGSSQDQEKEAHFQTGRARVNGMDYVGAIEAFQRALEINPQSAAAHFELGWLYADKQPDPAAAIYHYERYLALRPQADNAETIRQHIFRLKQDLAKAVLPLPSTPGVQRQLEQLMEENRRLQEEVEKWRAHYAARGMPSPLPVTNVNLSPARPVQSSDIAQTPRPSPPPSQAQAAPSRTYKVRAGDTPSSIARKCSVKLDALLSANPGLNPTRMQVGQMLNVPSSGGPTVARAELLP